MYDLAVIGGGPTGSTIARLASDRGYNVVLFEEHSEPGTPVQCAGLVSDRVKKLVPFPESCVLNTVNGARIMGPEGELCLESSSKKVLVIDRRAFDEELWSIAKVSGVETRTSSKVLRVKEHKEHCILEMQGLTIKSRFVAGCDGPTSVVRRAMELSTPKIFLSGVGVEAKISKTLDTNRVHLMCGRRVAPGFFAWAIPLDNDKLRLGLAVNPAMARGSAREYMQRIIDKPETMGLSGDLKTYGWNAGVIPLSPPSRAASERVLLAGDAACQVKATSGGGIVMGLKAASHAVETISKALSLDENLLPYDRAWHRDIGREIARDWALHTYYGSMDDEKISKAFKKLSGERARRTINKMGDIDYPSRLVFPLLLASPGAIVMFFQLMGKYAMLRWTTG